MRWVSRVSNGVLSLEKRLITALVAVLAILIVLNIVTRAAGAALFWVDELAVYAMIWMAFAGASVMVRTRTGVAVTLVTDLVPPALRRIVHRTVDAVLLVLTLALLVLCWQWYDPVALLAAGLDLDAFAASTFKFIYTEPTSTIGIPKFWVWLAVPFMALAMTIHALANLLEGPREEAPHADLGERPASGA